MLPMPTILVTQKIEAATANNETILLIGDTMGGGPCTSTLKRHPEAGLKVYAVPAAALTFNDNLQEVDSWGVRPVLPDETNSLKADTVVRTGDVALDVLGEALSLWDIQLDPDVVAVAVLDHGTAPQARVRGYPGSPILRSCSNRTTI